MRRSGICWGVLLLIIGGLLLLANLGFLTVNIWGLIWPVFLILIGLWVLIGFTQRRQASETERVSIPLDGAEKAYVRIDHGVGRAFVGGGTEPGVLMSGDFGGGLNYRTGREGAEQRLTMKLAERSFPVFFWPAPGEFIWDFRLTRDVPLSVRVDGAAGTLDFDMTDLRVTDLKVEGRVGTAVFDMPARAGTTRADIEGGVGTLTIRIPEGVAARIRAARGLGTISVDQTRFPRTGESTYESPGYDAAENRVEIRINGGVGTVTIR